MMRGKGRGFSALLALSVLSGAAICSIAQDLPSQVVHYPDVVVVNGKVLTADDQFTIAEGVAIRDGKFLAAGSNTLIRQMAGPQTKVIDVRGKTVIPGIINTHFHLGDYAERPLNYWNDVEEMFEAVKQRVASTPEGKWIILWYISTAIPKYRGKVSREQLDRIAPKHPVAIGAHTTSIYYLNSLAFENMQWPETDGVAKDPQTGEPTGVVMGKARRQLTLQIGWMEPVEEKVPRQKEWIEEMIKMGTTAIATHIDPPQFTALREIWSAKELKVRFRLTFRDWLGEGERFVQRIGNLTGVGDDMLRITGLAPGAADGFVGGGRAWTFDPKIQLGPWSGDLPTGDTGDTWKQTQETLVAGVKYGWSIGGMHSEGDRATAEILAAYEKARTNRLVRSRDQTIRLDHESILREDEMRKMKELGIVPAVVTWHVFSSIPNLVKMYGVEKVGMMSRGKSYLDAGLKPVAELSFACPFWSIQKKVTREEEGKIYGPSERVSREEALKMHTNYAAAYFNEQDQLGTIEPGKLADLVVVDGDYMKIPENQIETLPVFMTILGGKVVFETQNPAACKNTLAEKSGAAVAF